MRPKPYKWQESQREDWDYAINLVSSFVLSEHLLENILFILLCYSLFLLELISVDWNSALPVTRYMNFQSFLNLLKPQLLHV